MAQDPIVGDIGAILYRQPTQRGRIAFVKPKPGELAALVGRYKMPANYFAPNAVLTLEEPWYSPSGGFRCCPPRQHHAASSRR